MLLNEFGSQQVLFPLQTEACPDQPGGGPKPPGPPTGHPSYTDELNGYFSAQQASTHPACFFRPKSAQQVARAILICRSTRTPFAVKSGGHVPFAGASNCPGGVTVDLADLNQIIVHHDENTELNKHMQSQIVSVGSGNKWLDVYRALEPQSLTVVGGRVAGVGVGGLILGGGISFFSNLYGMSCDNVVNFEVVTAAGEIIHASQDSHPDLYRALRGGGGNLGVVTRFDCISYPQDMMWGGDRYHEWAYAPQLVAELMRFGDSGAETTPEASLIIGFAHMTAPGFFGSATPTHAHAQAAGTHPAVFDALLDIPAQWSDCGNKHVSEMAAALESLNDKAAGPMRHSHWTLTAVLDEQLALDMVYIFRDEVEKKLVGVVEGIMPGVGLQVLSLPLMRTMARAGGNCIGLQDEDRPLLLVNPTVRWLNAIDDDLVMSVYANIVARSNEAARVRGLQHAYLYMNYASQFQDPITGYGRMERERLRAVARKYDPDGVFQTLNPGHFKIDGGSYGAEI